MNIPPELIPVFVALFNYSFTDIDFDWNQLTDSERKAVGSEETWNQLVLWIQENSGK